MRKTTLWLCCRGSCVHILGDSEEEAENMYAGYRGGPPEKCVKLADVIVKEWWRDE